jgi:succinate-semialdehyde dehydrogenase / glutarate-semialdehyde dehydrogenase
MRSINPATEAPIRDYPEHGEPEVEDRLHRAERAYASWRRTTFADRSRLMARAAKLLRERRADYAGLMTEEMGKPIAAAEAEVDKCAGNCEFYAEHAEAFLAGEPVDDPEAVGASKAFTRYEPLGVVLAVMPWNFPLWQVVRFAAPALMAGNVGLLKHASNVPQCALYLEDLFTRAGFPDGTFQTLLIGAGQVESVLRDRRVAAATVTGSEPAGQSVAAICGEEIKKTVLELGGSDAFVVMPSADIARAAEVAVTARCQNNGQSCIAAKRFIVHDAVYDEFAGQFVERMEALRVGDPMDESTDIGPVATEQGRVDLEELVGDAVGKGADVLCGGSSLEGPGWFYPPTVVGGITPSMRMHLEETFGPVATLYRVPDIDAAIELANATSFGLGSNAWTTDPAEQDRFVNELEAGAVFINGMTTSYPELPFGGIKRSGYGRELSAVGIREFCNLKSVWVA